MKYFIASAIVLAATGLFLITQTVASQNTVPAAPLRPAQPPVAAPAEAKKPTVMQRKLISAQKVLEGLAMNNFDTVTKSSDELMQCVKEVTWKINETEKYMLYTNEFIRDIENLKKAATKKNTDSATLAYVQMTLTCMKCHEMLRETRIGFNPDAAPFNLRKTVATE